MDIAFRNGKYLYQKLACDGYRLLQLFDDEGLLETPIVILPGSPEWEVAKLDAVDYCSSSPNPVVAPDMDIPDPLTVTQDDPVSVQFTNNGGLLDNAVVSSGALPAGLSLDVNSGVAELTGTPTTEESQTVTVDFTNAAGTQQVTFEIVVDPPVVAPAMAVADPVSLSLNDLLSLPFDNNGGLLDNAVVSSGALPAGLSLDVNSGVAELTGTPTTEESQTVTVDFTNAAGTQQVTFEIVVRYELWMTPVVGDLASINGL